MTMGNDTAQSRLERLVTSLSPDQRRTLARLLHEARDPAAVIGMSCRFPGAADPQEYWRMLRSGVDAVDVVPAHRWDVDAHYAANGVVRGKSNTRHAGLIDDIDGFDARFFGISPREAARMDPQHRVLLEVTWNALQDAELTADALAATATGVFIGIGPSEYSWMQPQDPELVDVHSGTGISSNVAAGRISYLLDLRGPSLAVDTGCSSALVALHLAVQSLDAGESDVVVVGAANAVLLPLMSVMATQMGGSAPDGRCKAFDADADGYVRGEGVGVVVLTRLGHALANGYPVRAVVRGSAVNQDGRTAGLTAPNQQAQEQVITTALRAAGVDPADIAYVEAHGTGTPLGDPIELQAIRSVLGGTGAGPCYIGSAKTNVGHLEAAAGIAGLIKAVLAVEAGEIPPSLHHRSWTPHAEMDSTRFRVPTALTPWPSTARGRFAGVSAFGWSGTNAHVVLEQAPPAPPPATGEIATGPEVRVLPVSARSPAALRTLAADWAALLDGPDRPPTAEQLTRDLWTAAHRRTAYEYRTAFVHPTAAGLAAQARAFAADGGATTPVPARRPDAAFVFSGHGSQWVRMGAQLSETEPLFAAAIEECDAAIARWVDWSLARELAAPTGRSVLDGTTRADIVQPAVFAIQVALARLLAHWGVRPDVVLGHSMGEVAAAHVCGALGLPEAARVAVVRSRLAEQIAAGLGMALIDADEDRVTALLAGHAGHLAVAAVNSRGSVTVAGSVDALDEVLDRCRTLDVGTRRVKVVGATHCQAIEEVLPSLRDQLRELAPAVPAVPFRSTVAGWLSVPAPLLDAEYWADNLRRTVRFADAVDAALDAGVRTFVEVSPHPILLRALRESVAARGSAVERSALLLPTLTRGPAPAVAVRRTVADLWERGHRVDWTPLTGSRPPARRHAERVPGYPWQRRRYWSQAAPPAGGAVVVGPGAGAAPEPEGDEPVTGPRALAVRWRALDRPAAAPSGAVLLVAGEGAPAHPIMVLARAAGRPVGSVADVVAGRTGHPEPSTVVVVAAPPADDLHSTRLAGLAASATDVIAVGAALPRGSRLCVLTVGGAGPIQVDGPPEPDVPRAAAAHLAGFLRSMRLERPDLDVRLLDLAAGAADPLADLDTALAASGAEPEVAVRAGVAYGRRLVPLDLPPDQVALNPGGTYLITGGLGGVGIALARWLAERGATALVLAGRRPPTGPAADAVAELRAAGTHVQVHAIDVTDAGAVTELVAASHTPQRPLRGVFHLAGVLEDRLVTDLRAQHLETVLAPKLAGAEHLDRATAGIELTHFVLFSSLAAVLGSPGQAAYAGANAAADALVDRRRAAGRPGLSVAWGPWSDTGGAGAAWTARLARFGLRASSPAALCAVLGSLMTGPGGRAAVVDGDIAALAESVGPLLFAELAEAAAEPGADSAARMWSAAVAAGSADRGRLLGQCLRTEIASTLRVPPDEVDLDGEWSAIGLDSVTALEISAVVARRTGVRLTPRAIVECPSISSLATHLSAEVGSGVRS